MAYQGEVRRGAPALQRLCARRRGPGPAGASSARNAPSIEGRVSAMRLSGQRRLRQARRPSSVAGSGVARRRFRLVRPVVRRACCAPCACLAWRLERSSASRASAHGLGATASARWWLTREASVERSFKSASLCRVENLYYHSLITILTDTGRRPLSHGNCPWRSPSYCRAARTTRSQGAGDLGGALEELGAKARDDPSRACAFGRAHRRLARRPAPIIEYDLPLPVCPYRRGLCS
jgi:hypothetical protein